MKYLRPDRRWQRRLTTTLAAAALAMAFAIVFVAASSALTGSTFESTDGNLIVNGSGATATDWANAPNRTSRDDLTGSSQDDAFGQGTKEDDPSATVVQGSIPPNKSDLSRFYASHEKVGGSTFLYLAWERTNVLGSANMDFELNQAPTTYPTTGAVSIVRTAGDLLVTFDFTNGGSKPSLGLLTWLTSGSVPTVNGFATNSCFAANSFPCWGDRIDLGGQGLADGAINTVTVTDSIGSPSVSLPGSTFGEMAVNLSAALPNIFGSTPSNCESFGSAYLKSRSSASFTAEIKDFVRPQSISVSNCGYVLVHKVAADTGSDQAGATFSISPGSTDSTGTTAPSSAVSSVPNHAGYYCVDNLLTSTTYSVTETNAPNGYSLPSSPTQSPLSPTSGSCSDVTYTTPPTPTATFSDPVSLGYVLVHKTAQYSGVDQGGATFSIAPGKVNGSSTNTSDLVTAVSGHTGWYCVDGLRLSSTFTVTETAAPSGYSLPSPASQGSLSATAGTCAGITWTSTPTATASFVDPVSLGYVLIHKTAGNTGADQAGASFTITPGKIGSTGTNNSSDTVPGVTNHAGYYCIDGLRLSATFSVTETAAPAGYDLPASPTTNNLSATAGSCSDVTYTSAPTATVSYVDPLAVGALTITKTGKDKSCIGAGNPAGCSAASTRLLANASFELKQSGAVVYPASGATITTGSNGTVCVSGIVPGSYTLHEKTAPTGYAAAADQTVAIVADTTCAGTGAAAPATASVVDQPLTTITVSTTPTNTGATQSTVQCVATTGGSSTGDSSAVATPHTTNAVTPGTYTCTVVIDP